MNQTEYQQRYLHNRRQKAKNHLGGQCVLADSSCEGDLEFDHIDPSKMEFRISNGIAKHYSWDKLVVELGKCQLLCGKHHLEKTQSEQRTQKHGYWMYRKWKCRCDACVKGNTEYLRESKKRSKEKQGRVAKSA